MNNPEIAMWREIERLMLLGKSEETKAELKPHIENWQDAFQEYQYQYERMMKIIGIVDDFVRKEEAYKLTLSKWAEILEEF
mgnify:CR=1 FL=1|tara:strand:+ start:592 stop:834 length:243 start_codon:yes stop_codon:yes gene_type:complete